MQRWRRKDRTANLWRRLAPAGIRYRLSVLRRRGRQAVSITAALLSACTCRSDWPVLVRAWRTTRRLPALMDKQSLPEILQQLDTRPLPPRPDIATAIRITRLADTVVAIDRHKKDVGPCLRRSVVRFHLLRHAGLPVVIHIGAQQKPSTGRAEKSLIGHAWLTLDDHYWEELNERDHDYVVMYGFPPGEG